MSKPRSLYYSELQSKIICPSEDLPNRLLGCNLKLIFCKLYLSLPARCRQVKQRTFSGYNFKHIATISREFKCQLMKQQKLIANLWAKKNRDKNGKPMWLPLEVHLNDTMEVCGLLYEHWLSPGVKDFLKKSLESDAADKTTLLKNLCKFLGAVHDIGKATPIFQTKKSKSGDRELDEIIETKLKQAGFTGLDAYISNKKEEIYHNVSGQHILTDFGVNLCIADIVGAHHGRPVPKEESDRAASYTSSLYQADDEQSEMAKAWKEMQRSIFINALKACNFSQAEDLPLISQPGQVILSGLLIMADWITSNEKYFPLIDLDTYECASERVQSGFTKWSNDRADTWEPEAYNKCVYQNRFDFEPREVQRKISEQISAASQPGIVILEAPMGSGKTEAALVAVEDLANKTHRTGMFFGLPTQATSNGIFPRVEEWLKHFEGEKSIRLIHGKAQLNEAFANLPKNSDIHGEDGIGVNEWFAGRKVAILDDFIVGTVDQILLAALKQKHLMLRHLGFSNKVIVIDEVHAYDAYMSVYLYQALRWFGAYKVPVVILSATLPVAKRNKLLESYMIGAGYKYKTAEKPQNFAKNEAYPLLTYNDGSTIKQFSDFEPGKNVKYEINPLPQIEKQEVVELIKKLTLHGGVVGVIVNTVRKSQELAAACVERFGEEKVELLHSAFVATERYRKEKELLDTIGKNGNRPKFKIIIGTQVIEQSLDIDFDVLITELAPMDFLLQRMGRLHRHSDTPRPENLKNPQVYVLNATNCKFDKASTYVYSEYLLFRTEYYLPKEIELPKDISHLVQEVYADNELNLSVYSSKLQQNYNCYKDENISNTEKKEAKAKIYRLGIPLMRISEDKNLAEWIRNDNHSAELSDVKACAQVRDGIDVLEVIALKSCAGGYELLDVPGRLNPADNRTAMEIAKHTIKLPSAVYYGQGIDNIIEKLEDYYKKHFADWDNQRWLKGSLAIIFDKNNEFVLDKTLRLRYDNKYGLKVIAEDKNE